MRQQFIQECVFSMRSMSNRYRDGSLLEMGIARQLNTLLGQNAARAVVFNTVHQPFSFLPVATEKLTTYAQYF